jgi:hypothetical protein
MSWEILYLDNAASGLIIEGLLHLIELYIKRAVATGLGSEMDLYEAGGEARTCERLSLRI